MAESSKNYFTQETEDWILKYNQTSDPEEKNKIFRDHLYFPFYKLAENIINTFKFYNIDTDSIEDLKLDVITMLIEEEKLARFDPNRVGKSGKKVKAFSYFGTIIKRWLIATSNKDYQRKLKQTPVEYYEDEFSENPEIETEKQVSLSDLFDMWVAETYEHLEELFPKLQDRQTADAVLTVFRTRKDLNPKLFKKKAFYIYIREITNCETPYLTKVLLKLKELFYERMRELQEKDLLVRD